MFYVSIKAKSLKNAWRFNVYTCFVASFCFVVKMSCCVYFFQERIKLCKAHSFQFQFTSYMKSWSGRFTATVEKYIQSLYGQTILTKTRYTCYALHCFNIRMFTRWYYLDLAASCYAWCYVCFYKNGLVDKKCKFQIHKKLHSFKSALWIYVLCKHQSEIFKKMLGVQKIATYSKITEL